MTNVCTPRLASFRRARSSRQTLTESVPGVPSASRHSHWGEFIEASSSDLKTPALSCLAIYAGASSSRPIPRSHRGAGAGGFASFTGRDPSRQTLAGPVPARHPGLASLNGASSSRRMVFTLISDTWSRLASFTGASSSRHPTAHGRAVQRHGHLPRRLRGGEVHRGSRKPK